MFLSIDDGNYSKTAQDGFKLFPDPFRIDRTNVNKCDQLQLNISFDLKLPKVAPEPPTDLETEK